ncbi:MAG: alpha/beta hydrolase [Pseudomonadota bacterium]
MSTPPLFMLHAVTRARNDFGPFLQHLGGISATPLDLLGHGDAPRADRYQVRDYADALPLPEGTVALYGHSLGGLVALRRASIAPGTVTALILEDPPLFDSRQPRRETTPWPTQFRKLKSIMTRRGADWSHHDWKRAVAAWPSGHGAGTFADQGEDHVDRRAAQIANLDPAVLDGIVSDALHTDFDIIEAVRAAACPIVLVAGDRDEGSALHPDDVQLLAAEPNVTVVHAPGHGHYLREARPDLCAQAVEIALKP